MKLNKRVYAFGVSFMLLGGLLTTVYAASVVDGKNYQTVTIKDIPAWGNVKYNLTLGSRKTDYSTVVNYATFKKIRTEAALGNYAALVDSSKNQKSNTVRLNSTPTWANERDVFKDTVYYSGVTSSSLEPSNSCDVTYSFSANQLED